MQIFDTLLFAIGLTICMIAAGLVINSTLIVLLSGLIGAILVGSALFLTRL